MASTDTSATRTIAARLEPSLQLLDDRLRRIDKELTAVQELVDRGSDLLPPASEKDGVQQGAPPGTPKDTRG